MNNNAENSVINIKPENMYIYALVWACDNTPIRGMDMFVASYSRAEEVLKPFYEPKGVRVVCISSVDDEENTEPCIIF